MMDRARRGGSDAENKEKIIRRLAEVSPEEILRRQQTEREKQIATIISEASFALHQRNQLAAELERLLSEPNPGGVEGLRQRIREKNADLEASFAQMAALGVANPLEETRLMMEQKLRERRASERRQTEPK